MADEDFWGWFVTYYMIAKGQRCVPGLLSLNAELAAWHTGRNESQKGVDWHFTAADARIKLRGFIPWLLNIQLLQPISQYHSRTRTKYMVFFPSEATRSVGLNEK